MAANGLRKYLLLKTLSRCSFSGRIQTAIASPAKIQKWNFPKKIRYWNGKKRLTTAHILAFAHSNNEAITGMKHLKSISLTLVGALTILACKNEPGKIKTEQIENEEHSGMENPIHEEPKTGFQKTLTSQNITFDIKTTGEGSIRQLSIQPKGLEIANQDITLEIEGEVVDAEIADLNADGSPEILIYTVSAGSGSYGNVVGYSVNNGKSLSQIYFPEISENKEASAGYMGHDEFAVVKTSLVRRYPVYRANDSNSNPTGGTRQIHYRLEDGEASRLFVIEKISGD